MTHGVEAPEQARPREGSGAPAPARSGEGGSGSNARMGRASRLALALASVMLGLVYVQPLWKINLEAPQYPEGIGMEIWVNDVRGQKPNDLKNINGLNHYIGMKEIHAESIPELRIMPWIIAALMISGLLVAVLGRRWMLYGWAVLFVLVALAGMVDFYLWEYDYGHNLDPTAAIKIPGMSYQPPLIGSKPLLNFVAASWPGPGGWAVVVSCATACIVSLAEFTSARRRKKTI